MKENKEFTYNEVLSYNKKQIDYIRILQNRLTSYHLYLYYLTKKDKVVPPQEILKQFSKIDASIPLFLLDSIEGN